jgi:NADH dehydrogenase [ubiquinone] 1 alpha subcomplex assembly factor 1
MIFLINALLSLQIFSMNLSHKESSVTLFDFSENSDIKNWRIINDDVMGGISSATFNLSTEGHGLFQGKVSTENNGGFASVRFTMNKIKCENHNMVRIILKGDGKNYQFRIKNNNSDYFSYVTTFSTNGEWQTIDLKLKDFYPSFRGRKLDIPNFNKKTIEQISILIANKKKESFSLEIDKIELY